MLAQQLTDSCFNATQTRLPHGFEYVGRPLDLPTFVLSTSVPGLLSAVNALQTSPIVSMTLAAGQGSCRHAVASLAAMVGKYHATMDLSPDSTPQSISRSVSK